MDELVSRFSHQLLDRIGGPLSFRLVLQPLVVAVLATRAGLRDARTGHPPFGWAAITDSVRRRDLLREGWRDVTKVFFAAILIDFVYQIIAFRWIYPGESLAVAAILALLPYPVVRGVVNRIARRFVRG
jgi:hypothetical protein